MAQDGQSTLMRQFRRGIEGEERIGDARFACCRKLALRNAIARRVGELLDATDDEITRGVRPAARRAFYIGSRGRPQARTPVHAVGFQFERRDSMNAPDAGCAAAMSAKRIDISARAPHDGHVATRSISGPESLAQRASTRRSLSPAVNSRIRSLAGAFDLANAQRQRCDQGADAFRRRRVPTKLGEHRLVVAGGIAQHRQGVPLARFAKAV